MYLRDPAPRVFEPFFSTKPRGRAAGLGLSAVLGIARQAGGHLLVRSRPGHGARFSIYVPMTARAPVELGSHPVQLSATATPDPAAGEA